MFASLLSILSGCGSVISALPLVGTPVMVGHDLGYLPIHDIPSHDDATLLNPDEQSQLASELTAARDRNELLGKFEKPKPMKQR
jgi:hypothetical protein